MFSPTKREGAGPPPAKAARFDPVAGTIVDGKYRIEKVLGEGGMGLVVSAVHLGLDQEVAIKFLLPEAMRSRVAVERFLREAKVAAKVRSEHVARVHDVGTLEGEGGVPYIVMEHLEGFDLGQLIDKEGALPIDEACEIALQACEALVEVHAAGIVHRDLKPSNLFVTRRADGSPSVKLLDFGISKLTFGGEDSIDPALTQTATIMGSPSYMSPEQLKSTKEVDHRADVWSLGSVLYEAVTGKPAFRGESLPQVIAMIASEDPALPSSRRDGIPLELERTMLRCLDKDPGRRATLVELARTLVKFAPERGRACLERIEATAGGGEPRARALTQAEKSLPILAMAGERGRTMSSWGRDKRGKRGGGGALLLFLAASAAVAVAIYTGRIGVNKLRGNVADATSAMSSAAGAVSSAVSSVSSAVASAMPPMPSMPSVPVDGPAASASADPDPSDAADAASPSAVASGAPTPATHPAAPKPHAKPLHHASKPGHRHHS